jgi:hypothetical protein
MSAAPSPEAFHGAWSLLAWRIDYADGRPSSYPFGEDATGLLLYTPEGRMSAGISRAGRAGFGGGSVRHAGVEARAAAFDSHFHYQGTFGIDGDSIVHTVSESHNPDFVGTRQVRRVKFEGDFLELSADDLLPGTSIGRHHVLRWRRVAGMHA